MNTESPSTQNISVLIAEDDVALRFLIVEALLQANFTVEEAEDGVDCMEKLEICSPDIILLDVLMPRKDGFQTCEEIRKLSKFSHTPVLMMTGLDDDHAIQSSYDAGATDFISKPVNFNLLIQRIKYISRSGKSTQLLAQTQRRLLQAQELAKLGYWEWNAFTQEVIWSESLFNILQLDEKDLMGRLESLIEHTLHEDKKRLDNWLSDVMAGHQLPAITFKIQGHGKINYLYQQARTSFNQDGNLAYVYGSVLDVTDINQANEKIRELAYFDSLTQLPNRTYFHDILEQAINLDIRNNRKGALLFIDLDHFKRVNDTLGHHSGDLLLIAVTQRIKKCIRKTDIVTSDLEPDSISLGRLAGDEFALLLPEISQASDAALIAKRIVESFINPFVLEDNRIDISASIGISVFPDDSSSSDQALRNSDIAMYYAKNEGKNCFRFYDEEMHKSITQRIAMEKAMSQALAKNEFKLVYQPQVNLETGQIFGAEALIRWESAELGLIMPEKFIPLAEETGFIIQIGEWVLREACQQAMLWREQGIELNRIAVNVSTRQFSQSKFVETVAEILSETKLPAHILELEMTETLLMAQAEAAVDILMKLKELGVCLSIDDFGTGYSSLAYLKQFPIDHLKIDKAFIGRVDQDHKDAAIVKAVIAMANSLQLRVTAEGIETKKQLDFLETELCEEGQGYFFSKPLSVREIEEYLQTRAMLS